MREPKSLRARAMDILSRREVSRLELQRKLAPYAEDEDELNQVLAEFAERNWQSDERFTEAFVNSKSRKHGALRLKQALAAKGIDSEMAREFLPDSETELANAKEVLRKNSSNLRRILRKNRNKCGFCCIADLAWIRFRLRFVGLGLKTMALSKKKLP